MINVWWFIFALSSSFEFILGKKPKMIYIVQWNPVIADPEITKISLARPFLNSMNRDNDLSAVCGFNVLNSLSPCTWKCIWLCKSRALLKLGSREIHYNFIKWIKTQYIITGFHRIFWNSDFIYIFHIAYFPRKKENIIFVFMICVIW